MPRKVFTAGEILTAADVNTNLMDQSVMVFAGTAARGSAIPTPSEGMVTYLEDSDSVQVYTTAWEDVGVAPAILQVVSTYVSATFSTTSGTAVDMTGYTVNITPSSTSSKVLIMFTTQESFNSTAGGDCDIFINRGATQIAGEFVFESSGDNDQAVMTGHYVDSPNTTSSTTYKLQAQTNFGTAEFRRGTLTVMEVAG